MEYKFLIIFFIFFGLFTLCIVSTANAQSVGGIQSSVSVTITPRSPGPNQTVNVVLESYATDLNSATITYKIDGKEKQKGIGLKRFSFTTGNMNTTTELSILIQTREGEDIEKTYTIRPTSVDLIWQSESFVPPFYKGKALFGHQSRIKFIALPHIIGENGQEIPAKRLVYKWTKNGTVLGDYSGYGMDTYTMVGSIISRPLDMEVEVTSSDYGGIGRAETLVTPIEPTVLMYEKNPLYGIQFQKALTKTVELNNSREIAVVGAPFFFGTTDTGNPDLQYKWAINGVPIDNSENPVTQVFRQKEGTAGTSLISLSVENISKILQFASGSFNLTFSNTN